MGPCDWPAIGCGDCPELEQLGDETTEGLCRRDIEEMAAASLWHWTGRQFGLCEVELRPGRQNCGETIYRGQPAPWTPVLVGGEWFNVTCGSCPGVCGCDEVTSIRLPGPVAAVEAVTIDGEELDPEAYRVDNRKLLVRQDGHGWPPCNDMGAPAGDPGTWSVRYLRGTPVPRGGQVAAGMLACEMAKAICQSGDCRLPQRIQTVTREGVTVGVLDPFDGIEFGRTGIWVIDHWVASVTRAPKKSTVHSPDRATPRATTFQGPLT